MSRSERTSVMLNLKILAFVLPLIGLSGIVGTIETGESPMNAVVVFLIGCLVMTAYIKQSGCGVYMERTEGKEEVMGGIEKDELAERTQGMTLEEMCIVAGFLPDDVLWQELYQRYSVRSAKVENVEKIVR